MKTSQVATALLQVAGRRHEFDAALFECLNKLIKSTLLKSPTLESLQSVYDASGREFSTWLIERPTEIELGRMLAKFDPHTTSELDTCAAKRTHLLRLMSRELKPTPRPPRPGRPTPLPAMNADDIVRLSDPTRRRAELEKLSAAQLKSAIKKHQIYGGSLSAKPSKAELIEHIQVALQSGWPDTGSVLDTSRY